MKKYWKPLVTNFFLLLATLVWLKYSGRSYLGPDGGLQLWYGEANGPGTSQHLLDPYSFTHFLHGVVFFWIISFFGKNLEFAWQLTAAIAFESCWEVIENSKIVIERYREATMALGYFGDSIVNSFSDIAVCSIGFCVAARLGLKKSLVLFAILEIFLLFWIKDNLTLNVIMLIYPLDFIKSWQTV